MAKKSVIARQVKREKLVKKFASKHEELKKIIQDKTVSMTVKEEAMKKLWAMPRDASPVRLRNRCALTGRPRGVFRRFGLCRQKIRDLARMGQITGLLKSSW
jgi:small subunit ribosomal protein S14